MNKINPLIVIPSPRDLQPFKESIDKVNKYDKLWLKYSPEHISYPIIRDQFLKNNEKDKKDYYTHIIICPDDLLIDDPKKIDLLLEDYNSFPEKQRDKIILSGYCNVDTSEFSKYANVTRYKVSNTRHDRTYKWFTLKELENSKKENFLIKVQFSGFALMVIPRSAIEQIPFRNDSWSGKFDDNGCCIDVMFCNDAIEKGYKIYVDSRIRLFHLKFSDTSTSQLLQQMAKTESEWKYYYEYASSPPPPPPPQQNKK